MFELVEPALIHVDELCCLYSNVAASSSLSLSDTVADSVVASVDARWPTHGYGAFRHCAPFPPVVEICRPDGVFGVWLYWICSCGLSVNCLCKASPGLPCSHSRNVKPPQSPAAALAMRLSTSNPTPTVALWLTVLLQLPGSGGALWLIAEPLITPGLLFQVVFLPIVPVHDKVTVAVETQSEVYASAAFTVAVNRCPPQIDD